jgi:hypothetical protein
MIRSFLCLQEREERIETKRRQQSGQMNFAFGSSTPRILGPRHDSSADIWGGGARRWEQSSPGIIVYRDLCLLLVLTTVIIWSWRQFRIYLNRCCKMSFGVKNQWRHRIFFSDLHLPLTSITRWLSPCTVVDLRNAINLISTTPSPWSTTTGPPRGRRQPTGSTKVEKVKVVDDESELISFPFRWTQRFLTFTNFCLHFLLFEIVALDFVLSVTVDA